MISVNPAGTLLKWINSRSDCVVLEHRGRDESLLKQIRCYLSTCGVNVPMKPALHGHAALRLSLALISMAPRNRIPHLLSGLGFCGVSCDRVGQRSADTVLYSRRRCTCAETSFCWEPAFAQPAGGEQILLPSLEPAGVTHSRPEVVTRF